MQRTSAWYLRFYLFAAVAMSYGWGWRGVYGHEAGAMLPGALVAMAICLGSGRRDWYRRSVIAGLAGAVGWAWGGQISNMEHRLYIMSTTLVDAVYGFACIGFLGALWSGIGGATLALALTHSRRKLNRFIGPLAVQGTALAAGSLFLFFFPEQRREYFSFTAEYLHDSSWLPITLTLVALIPYWLIRKSDRPASGLMILCAAAWWIGYLTLTKFGGLELAPPHRSESWSGVLGILAVLILYHIRNQDRAALMLTQYAMLAGCIGFILALQIHVPFANDYGPFVSVTPWKFAEESFGFFMGFGVAMGAGRLLQGGLAAAAEDAPRDPLDLFAAFVLLVAMFWMNLRMNVTDWGGRYHVLPEHPLAPFKPPFPQLEAWHWFLIAGIFWTAIVLDGLRRYRQRRLAVIPQSAFGKGSLVLALLLAVSLSATTALSAPDFKNPSALFAGWTYFILTGLAIWMLMSCSDDALSARESTGAGLEPESVRWRVGWKYWALWAWIPLHVYLAGVLACEIVDEPWKKAEGRERHRFGPNATWRLELQKQRDAAEP